MEKDELELRGNGKLSVIYVEADNLAEATYKSIIASYDGARAETPKHKQGYPLGYDV